MKIQIVRLTEWEALYVDGRLACENSKISPEDVLDALGIGADFEYLHGDDEWFPENRMPLDVADVKLWEPEARHD